MTFLEFKPYTNRDFFTREQSSLPGSNMSRYRYPETRSPRTESGYQRPMFRSGPELRGVGVVHPDPGANPLLAEKQAYLWIVNLLVPEQEADEDGYEPWGSHKVRVRYGVHHDSCAHHLAFDYARCSGYGSAMKGAPDLGYRDHR
ncbi:hypothetical protein F4778DRAFT_775838 [Xylariomycetidae sp. FL2044]|nr:hypothetical protein F4778DRAFT_775838 [Xylariomycetidae sp. FL2044]